MKTAWSALPPQPARVSASPKVHFLVSSFEDWPFLYYLLEKKLAFVCVLRLHLPMPVVFKSEFFLQFVQA